MKMEKSASFSLVFSSLNVLLFDILTYKIPKIVLIQGFMDILAWSLMVFFASTLILLTFFYLRVRRELKVIQTKSALPKLKVPVTQKKLCPKCKAENASKARFCRKCGFSLKQVGIVCSSCQEVNRPTARFCHKCGKPLR